MILPEIKSKPWRKNIPPRKILVVRFQAIGDVVITLPYLQDLKDKYPRMEIHFLTRSEAGAIPEQFKMFDRVIRIGGGRNAKIQMIIATLILPFLWWQRYDVVVDLQNHRISRILRKFLFPEAWSEFDRSSPIAAGERTRATINALGLVPVTIAQELKLRSPAPVIEKMRSAGWKEAGEYIILNPAGAFGTRNWALESYVAFANHWLKKDNHIQFVILGLPSLEKKGAFLKEHLGDHLIDLTGKTNIKEAFTIVRKAKLVLSEDSGLMHMAWTQRVPTIGIFGSSRSDWSSPLGDWSVCLNSADLPCGNCLLEQCKFNDNHCLTRFTPEQVFDVSVNKVKSSER